MIEKIEKAIEEMTARCRLEEREGAEAMRFSQSVVNLANARACLTQTDEHKHAKAIGLIRELSDRNDDETYRQAVKEIIEQCDI